MTDAADNSQTDSEQASQNAAKESLKDAMPFEGVLMDDFPLSLVVSDPNLPDNPLVYVNKAFTELTGYTETAALGRNCRFLQGPETEGTPVRELADAIAVGESAAVEIVNYTSAGDAFLNHLLISPIMDGERVAFFVGVQASDGAQSREQELSSKLRGDLATISRTIRDPLESILQILRSEVPEPDAPREVITLLSSRIESLAQLYAGVFRRHGRDADGRTRLGAYLSRVCSSTHLSDRSYNVRISSNFIDASVPVETAAMIGLLLSEVLANAFDRSNPYDNEAHIEVALAWKGKDEGKDEDSASHLRLTVSDTSDTSDTASTGGADRKRSLLPRQGTVGRRIVDAFKPRLDTRYNETADDEIVRVTLDFPTVRPDDEV